MNLPNTPAPSDSGPAAQFTPAFFDALLRCGIRPEEAAPHCPGLAEFEVAAQMVQAQQRRCAAQAEERLRRTLHCPVAAALRSTWGRRTGPTGGRGR